MINTITRATFHPWNRRFERAYWIDNYEYASGHRGQAVLFEDGLVVNPSKVKLTCDDRVHGLPEWSWKPKYLE